ncbi:Acid phosphatase type 7 [Yarrowia sp. C11]|nr:Acid phosphatase type 7 [Yarrowia sp. C11]KAG5370702.1 Acid phosphatase type 7 [Yarrowia sp. E02]
MKFSTSVVALLASALAINGVFAIPQVKNPVPQNILEPVQFRVAFAGAEAGKAAAVSWNTYGELSGAPTLRYGLDPDNLSKVASGQSNTYATSTTWNHHVVLEGLEPGTVYYYRVEGSDPSKTFHFKTALAPGTNKEFTFAAAIDLGVMGEYGLSTWVGEGAEGPLKPGEKNTIDSLLDDFDKYEFLLHPGDIAYSDYWLKEEIQGYLPNTTLEEGIYVYEALLNTYYQQMEGLTAYKQYMVSPGNHEANCNNGGTSDKKNNITYTADMCFEGQTNFTGLRNHFRMPAEESGGVGPMWYSYDYGLVHFVSINTETDFEDAPSSTGMRSGEFGYPGQQLDWLRADLANVDREKTPWVVVSGHRPWYIDAKKKDVCTDCQNAFEDILVDGNVDVVLMGHVHLYERNHPVAHGKVDPNGLNNPSAPWYIVNGAAGHYDGVDFAAGGGEEWIAYTMDGHYGWSSFTVHNCSHLTHEFVFSENNTRLDRQTLFKDRKCKLPIDGGSSVSILPSMSSIPGVESGSGVNGTVTKTKTVTGDHATAAGTTPVSKDQAADVTKTVVKPEASTVTETYCEKCHSETNESLLESAAETAQTEKEQSKAATVVQTVHETVAGSANPTVSVATAPVVSVAPSAVASISASVSAAVFQPSSGAEGSTPALANDATLARISPIVMGVALVAVPAWVL